MTGTLPIDRDYVGGAYGYYKAGSLPVALETAVGRDRVGRGRSPHGPMVTAGPLETSLDQDMKDDIRRPFSSKWGFVKRFRDMRHVSKVYSWWFSLPEAPCKGSSC